MSARMEIKLKPSFDMQATLRMFEQDFVRLRAKAVMRYITHAAAENMLETVRAKIPSGATYNSYRDSLKLVQYPSPEPVFAIYGEESSSPVNNDRDILYIRIRNTGRRIPPAVKLLVQYQPWTADTLPMQPPSALADVVKRRVSEREVELVKQEIEKKRREWTSDFMKAGVTIKPGVLPDAKATADLAYTAMRLEYGLGGSRAVAHWRPALVSIQRQVAKLFTDEETVGRARFDWSYGDWKRWRNLSAEYVPATVIESFQGFQDKLS